MSFENNRPTITNYGVDGMRDISARRANTISNMIDEAKKEGISDDFARRAIGKYGTDNAIGMREAMKDPDSFDEFRSLFGTDHNKDKQLEAWKKQGRTEEEIAHLCDVTMEGDREFAKQFPNLTFTLEGTIAEGCPTCKLRFKKNV